MDLGITGLNALILGGSQGLGFACAQALAEAGVNIAINGRNAERAKQAITKLGPNAIAVPGDISTKSSRHSIMTQTTEQLGPLSIIINNAGGPPPGPVEEHNYETWLHALETNMLSAIDFAVMALPSMKESGFGRIINITSFTVKEPYANMGLATSVRAGLTGAMSSLAKEVAPFGITVNNVLPGLMDTGALERVYRAQAKREGISPDEAKARMASSIPMQRLGLAEDFGPVCAFLCSRHANYITNQNLTVDGGLVRSML